MSSGYLNFQRKIIQQETEKEELRKGGKEWKGAGECRIQVPEKKRLFKTG